MAMAANSSPKLDLNTDFFRTPAGLLRVVEGALALAAVISTAEGFCLNDGRYGFLLFVFVTSFLESIIIIIFFVFRLEKKIKFLNVPLTLLLNDCIALLVFVISAILSMLSIGRCPYSIAARIIASLFVITLVLNLVGLNYIDYNLLQEQETSKEINRESGTTVTESSPTVLS